MSVYPQAIVLMVLLAITLCLDLPVLIWHSKHHNLAPTVLICWVIITGILNFIDAALWSNDDLESWYDGNIYCDIHVKIQAGSSTGVPAATLCVLMTLAAVMDTNNITISPTKAQKRLRLVLQLFLCFAVPLISMLMAFVAQSDRYAIEGISGCILTLSDSWPTVAFSLIPPMLFVLANVYFACLIIFRLRKHRTTLDSILSTSGHQKSYFFRLFLLAASFVFFVLPVQLYLLYSAWPTHLVAYSWSETHDYASYWHLIELVPSFGIVGLHEWIEVISAALVFLFFGLGKEAREMYRSWLLALGLVGVGGYVKWSAQSLLSGLSIDLGLGSKAKSVASHLRSDRSHGSSSSTMSFVDLEKAKPGKGAPRTSVASQHELLEVKPGNVVACEGPMTAESPEGASSGRKRVSWIAKLERRFDAIMAGAAGRS